MLSDYKARQAATTYQKHKEVLDKLAETFEATSRTETVYTFEDRIQVTVQNLRYRDLKTGTSGVFQATTIGLHFQTIFNQ